MQKLGAMKMNNFGKQYKDYASTLKSNTSKEKIESLSISIMESPKLKEKENK